MFDTLITCSKKIYEKSKEFALNVIAPPHCYYCKKFLRESMPLCADCLALIKPIPSITLKISSHYCMNVYALSAYQEPIKTFIMAKSWGDITACKQMTTLMVASLPLPLQQADFLIPIPLHWSRSVWRGYNQAQELAHELSTLMNIPTVSLLTRIKRTPFQSMIQGKERKNNVADAFALSCYDENYRDKHLILIDDLMTSGATLQAAARVLTKLKPASLSAFVAARVI